jgi:hypothetical protein
VLSAGFSLLTVCAGLFSPNLPLINGCHPQVLAFKYGDELLFQPLNYVGRWYEVSSLKRGFSGAGQGELSDL